MANYCIFRTKKLKTDGNVGGSVSHALRTRETPNADAERTPQNWYNWKGSPEEAQQRAMAKYRALLPEKVRKNGVRAVELLMTASPEIMKSKTKKEQVAYLNDCIHWAEDVFGKENIFLKSQQFDETTPHVSMFLVPIDPKGKLNCRHYLGGREKLSALQTDFYERVGKKHGMERGIKGSKAKHQTIRQYYAELNSLDKAITPPKKKMLESPEEYQERYKQQIAPFVKTSLKTKRIKQQNEQHKKMQSAALATQKKHHESQITGLYEDLQKASKINQKLLKERDYWLNSSPEELQEWVNILKKAKVKNISDLKKLEKLKHQDIER